MTEPLRVAYLQKAPSGYMDACLRELVERGVRVLATLPPTLRDAPYDLDHDWLTEVVPFQLDEPAGPLIEHLDDFDPHVIVIVSWDVAAYRAVGRRFRGRAVRVLYMDNQWRGSPKQLLGVLTARWYLGPSFDRAFVPGARQRRFARLLGFDDDAIHDGLYTADVDRYATIPPLADDDRRVFAFVGRLAPEKGLDVLGRAYARYRQRVTDPWRLVVAGTGELADEVGAQPGVVALGFVQPPDLPAVLAGCSALVLPSRFEPWGVVVHEAAAAGLLAVVTDRVGAGDHLVLHRSNGYVVAADDVDELLAGLLWCHELGPEERTAASATARRLAAEYSPARWADEVIAMAASR